MKTKSSRRQIPIHSTLRELGLLEHVHARGSHDGASSSDQLFPDLERGGPDNRFGYTFTKWFTQYRRQSNIQIDEPGKDFHALRKTFSHHILRKQKVDMMVKALLGHHDSSMTNQHYFAGFAAHEMKETVELIDYGVDITLMRASWADSK